MSQTAYVLHHTEDQRELDRLRALAAVFDPASQRRIRSTGFTHGWRCLEVGAGAGAVASWMASVSGLSGHTTAIDSNTRFLTGLASGVRGVAGDMRIAALEPESFDLVHARSVLTHRPDVEVALESMLVALRQGGWLVLEEPDCTAARAIAGDKQAMQSVAKVNGALLRMFSDTGTDPSLGARLPGLLQKAGLKNLGVEYEGKRNTWLDPGMTCSPCSPVASSAGATRARRW
jgi:SAM-dependent methyltransferase